MSQEMYLVRQNKKFWHSKVLSVNPVMIQFRSGNLNTNWEQSEGISIQIKNYKTLQEGICDISQMIELMLRQGYCEVKPSEIVKTYEQIKFPEAEFMYELDLKYRRFLKDNGVQQEIPVSKKEQILQKIERKSRQLNEKSCVDQLNDATDGRLISQWPKNKIRPFAGTNMGLGPTFSKSQRISCLLSSIWKNTIDPRGYYMSEKLDGMRMIWTGFEMFTRNGYSLNFPTFFIEGWPTTYLDGELWISRGTFNKVLTSVRKRQPDIKAWQEIKYMVFDAPFLQEPFSDRYEKIKKAIEQIKNPYLVYVPHKVCRGLEHLDEELLKVQQVGGEGLMLRDPDSFYEGTRSESLLKVKSSLDAEATIIGYVEDTHMKKEDVLGGFLVKDEQGRQFEVGLGLKIGVKKNRPPIGCKITFKYCGFTDSGYPRYPEFIRVASDI